MKIMYITPGCFDKGGISRYSGYQIDAFEDFVGKEQFRAFSLLGRDNESFEKEINVHWAGRGNSFLEKIKFTLVILWNIITWRPTVVHIAHVNFSGLFHRFAKLVQAKTILNIYGLEVWSGLKKSAEYGLKNVDYIISDCHYTAQYVEDKGYRKKGEVAVIWDCANLSVFSPKSFNPEIISKYNLPDRDNNVIILTLGRLAKEAMHKGYDRLIHVFKNLLATESNIKLVIAGKGNNKAFLENLVEESGISEHVTFTGMVDEADLADIYRYSHIFSLVSDRGDGRGEGIPLTPIEAMACGKPIFVGNQDGSREAIFEKQGIPNGFTIDPFDLENHKNLFIDLIRDSEKLEEMSLTSKIIAEEVFSFETFKQKHIQNYRNWDLLD